MHDLIRIAPSATHHTPDKLIANAEEPLHVFGELAGGLEYVEISLKLWVSSHSGVLYLFRVR